MTITENYFKINYEYKGYFLERISPLLVEKPKYSYSKNAYISGENKTFFILDGIVRQFLLNEQGKEKTFLILGPGDFFGEVTYFQQDNNLAESEALTDCTIVEISEIIWQELSKDCEFLKNMATSLSAKSKILLYQIYDKSYLDIKIRIMNSLLRLAIQKGHEVEDGYLMTLDLSHEDIAKIANCTRENATKKINTLIKEGMLIKKDKYYLIKNQHLK